MNTPRKSPRHQLIGIRSPRTLRRRAGRAFTLSIIVAVAMLTLAACTGDDKTDSSKPSSSSAAGDGELPTAGSFVVNVSAEGDPVRIAVHNVRRIDGATVLEFSATLLEASGTDDSDYFLDSDFLGNAPNVNLVDVAKKQVYRPLLEEDGACACTAFSTSGLEVGKTQVQQAAFPELPDVLDSVTVQFASGPLLQKVPVLSEGKAATGNGEDLSAKAEDLQVQKKTKSFNNPVVDPFGSGDKQPLEIEVNRVVSGSDGATMQWTIVATGSGDGALDDGAPLTAYPLLPISEAYKTAVASGPGLRPSGADEDDPVARAWFSTAQQKAENPFGSGGDWEQCLCSDLQNLDADEVSQDGQRRTLVTHFPALAEGTSTVDVIFPDNSLPPLKGVKVEPASEAATTKTQDASTETWDFEAESSVVGPTFEPSQWPLPAPSAAVLNRFDPIVDRLVPKESLPAATAEQDKGRVEISLDSTVSFKPDSSKLTPQARKGIAAIAKKIDDQAAPGSKIAVDGHVAGSDRGSPAVQKSLSRDRANAVLRELESQLKFDVSLSARGFGASRPVAPNDSEANRKLNRRVTISYSR